MTPKIVAELERLHRDQLADNSTGEGDAKEVVAA